MNNRPNPYVGPRSFQPGEPFYGRDRELRSLAALLIAERIILLHSPSGSGKTSLIQAGLLPRLRDENFNVLPIIRVNAELSEIVSGTAGVNRYALSTMLSLEESLPESERRPVSDLATLTLDSYLSGRPRPADAPVSDVLIFDQFEEVLTYAPTDRESKLAFFEQLGKALRNKDRWALIAIREDYLGALAPYTRPIPGRLGATFRLDLLGVDGALQAVQKPAQTSSVNFLASAAAKLVDDLRHIQVQLPDGSLEEQLGPHVEPVQLQVVCYRLWQGLADDDTEIDESDLAGVGDVNRALADYYAASAQAVAQKSGASEREIREWFDRKLITPEGIRGQVLMGAEHSDGLPNRVVALLEDAHIIRGEKRAGKTWFELSHDRMIKPVRENNTAWFSANLSLFQQQAVLWAQQGKSDGLLLRGKELSQAESEAKTLSLTADEQSFLEACRKLHQREQRDKRQRQFIVVGLVASLILAVVAVYFGINANAATQEANHQAATAQVAKDKAVLSASIARSGELASQSVYFRDKNFLTSLLLGMEAFLGKNTPQARGALLNNANTNPQLRQILNGHIFGVNDIAFSPDGKTLASGSDDQSILLWDSATGKPLDQPLIGHTGEVTNIAFSLDGKTLASGSKDKTILLWDVATRKQIGQPLVGHTDLVSSVAFSPDGKTLASGSWDNSISLWDVATGKQIGQPLTGHTYAVSSVVFSPDGKTLASGSWDHSIILWDVSTMLNTSVATGKQIGQPLIGHTGVINSLAFSPDGKTLASGSWDKTIILWDVSTLLNTSVTTGKQIGQPLSGHTSGVSSVAFSPDGKTLASGSFDTTILLWDVATGQPISQPFNAHTDAVFSVAFSPNGKTLASSSYDRTIILWDVVGNDQQRIAKQDDSPAYTGMAFSPGGKTLASGSADGTMILWNVTSRQPIGQALNGHTDEIWTIAFSPDGEIMASGGKDSTIILRDVATGQPLGQPLIGHTSWVFSVAFSPDGKTLASSSSDKSILLWDVATGKPLGQPLTRHTEGVTSVAFSPDGKTLASGSNDKSILLWDLATRKPMGQPLTGHTDAVSSVVFSPDGKTLASGSNDNSIILWDVASHRSIAQPLTGHTGTITSIVFSADGKTLASSSYDNSIILWDVATRQPIGEPLTGHTDIVYSIAFSPDGKTLVSGSSDKTIIQWDIDLQSWLETSCRRAGRNFTRAEWEKYFPGEEYRQTCEQWPLAPEATPTP